MGHRMYTGQYKSTETIVLLVANPAGYQHLDATMNFPVFAADMGRAMRTVAGIPDTPTQREEHNLGVIEAVNLHIGRKHLSQRGSVPCHIPDKFLRLPLDTSATSAVATLPHPVPRHEADTAAHQLFPDTSDLLVDWRQLVYTDGSAPTTQAGPMQPSQRRTGSGIYRPASCVTPGGGADDELCVRLDPAGRGITNTINRAELAPIEHVLRHGLGTHIASDSACSLYQIERMIHKPMYMQQHKHAPMISAICDHIRASPTTIYMYKVPAHTGLIGNEKADQLAKAAACDECEDRDTCAITADTPMHSMYWPTYMAAEPSSDGEHEHAGTTPPDHDDATAGDGSDGDAPLHCPAMPRSAPQHRWHVADLKSTLKRRMHALYRLGHSNLESVYYQFWRNIQPIVDGPTSNAFMRLPAGTTPRQREAHHASPQRRVGDSQTAAQVGQAAD